MKRTKKLLSLLLTFALVLTIAPWSWISVSAYDEPTLNDEGYYELSTADHLYWFAEEVNSGNNAINGVLMNDIVVNEEDENPDDNEEVAWLSWIPIGNANYEYQGIFDGAGYTITNMICEYRFLYVMYVGMFGRNNGTIKNLNIDKSIFEGKYATGAICAYNGGTIENCHNFCDVTSTTGGTSVGGIAGMNEGTIKNSSNYGEINSAHDFVGGICGVACGKIEKCFNTGSVDGICNVGGIVGGNYFDTTLDISYCYNTGNISGEGYVGGIGGDGAGIVAFPCFSTGTVTVDYATEAFNGLFGYLTIENVFNGNTAYLKDSVKDSTGNVLPCFDFETVLAATEEEFKNGCAAYFLNANVTDGTQAWYQNIDNGEPVDEIPQYSGATVYENEVCTSNGIEKVYSNTLTPIEHTFVNRICTVCGTSLPSEIVTEENYEDLGLTEEYIGYYAIANANDLYWFADQVNNSGNLNINGVLLNDIVVNEGDLSGYDGVSENTWKKWTSIGTGELKVSPAYYFAWFEGVFDGNNHTISGIYCDNAGQSYTGLFGLNAGTIKNLIITNSYFSGTGYTGGICGVAMGEISNCRNGSTVNASGYAGGICGEADESITQCVNTGKVSGGEYTGGICGRSFGDVTQSYNTGNVRGISCVGGICGDINNQKLITSCYNTGTVVGISYVGAIAGDVSSTSYTDEGMIAKNLVECYYLSGCATDETGKVQSGAGTYIDDTDAYIDFDGYVLSKTAEQFASGEVAYLLNNEVTDGSQIWYQNIDNGELIDETPKYIGGTVYQYYNTCEDGIAKYSNTDKGVVTEHKFNNGVCEGCKASFINPWKSQIRFDKNDDGTFAGTFDYRVLATITSDDLAALFDAGNSTVENEAVHAIVEAGFVMTKGTDVSSFDYETAKNVVKGTSNAYTKVPVDWISTSFDSDPQSSGKGDYVISCIVEDIPEADKNMCLATMAYIVYNDSDGNLCYMFYPTIDSVCFEGLYEQYYSLAFPS